MTLFFITLSIYEPIHNYYEQIDHLFLVRLALWTVTFNFGVYFAVTMAIVMAVMFFTAVYYHNLHYNRFRRLFKSKLNLWINRPSKLETITMWLLLLFISFSNPPGNIRIDRDIQVLLKQLHNLNQSAWRFAKDASLFVFVVYYTMILTLAAALLIVIDPRTDPFIKLIAFNSTVISFTTIFGGFGFVTSLNYFAGKLFTPLDRCLFRANPGIQTKFKLYEFRSQLEQQMIGITCGTIFTLTVQKSSLILINFFLNIFLVMKLFSNYFF